VTEKRSNPDGNVILKWILSKEVMKGWTRVSWSRIGSSGEFCKHCNEPLTASVF
jgi:hypothetical protein